MNLSSLDICSCPHPNSNHKDSQHLDNSPNTNITTVRYTAKMSETNIIRWCFSGGCIIMVSQGHLHQLKKDQCYCCQYCYSDLHLCLVFSVAPVKLTVAYVL